LTSTAHYTANCAEIGTPPARMPVVDAGISHAGHSRALPGPDGAAPSPIAA